MPQTAGMAKTTIPTRFLEGCGGDEEEAQRRWSLTHAWRAAEAVDEFIVSPPGAKHVEALKALYTHAFHRRAKNGHVVCECARPRQPIAASGALLCCGT